MAIKGMKRLCIIAFSFCIVILTETTIVHAQDYKTSAGLRLSWDPGLTIKHFIKETAAIEAIIAPYHWNGVNVTLLYEKHAYAFNTTEFRWFYGIGGHVGIFNGSYDRDRYYKKYYDQYKYNGYDPYYNYNRVLVNLGIDAILGLEYKITEIPFTLGVDFKPGFDIVYPRFGWEAALSIRYYW